MCRDARLSFGLLTLHRRDFGLEINITHSDDYVQPNHLRKTTCYLVLPVTITSRPSDLRRKDHTEAWTPPGIIDASSLILTGQRKRRFTRAMSILSLKAQFQAILPSDSASYCGDLFHEIYNEDTRCKQNISRTHEHC